MNPQFCCPFVMRPKLVPVVVRPTVPVDYRTFDPPSPTYNIPLFPIHLTADVAPTTRKTRWELEKLGSPTDGQTKELFFELAAQKNGIRIGKEQNKGGATTKQSGSLEDFKKIAEKNGITVCPAGSQDKVAVTSEYSSVVNSTSDAIWGDEGTFISTTLSQVVLSSSSLSAEAKSWENSCSETHVGKVETAPEAPGNARRFEAEVEKEMNTVFPVTDLFKNTVAGNCLRIEETKDSEKIQTVLGYNPSTECEIVDDETLHFVGKLSTENKPVTGSYEPVVSFETSGKSDALQCESFEMKTPETRMGKTSSKDESENLDVEKKEESFETNKVSCVTAASSGTVLASEHVATDVRSLTEAAQIKTFQEPAPLKGIKVGNVSGENYSTINSYKELVSGVESVADTQDDQDAQIAKFQEMARLNGIRVGDGDPSKNSCDSSLEQLEFIMDENAQGSDYYTDMYTCPYDLDPDPQIALFQEIARLKGIKVSNSRSSSDCSSLPAPSEDLFFPQEDMLDLLAKHSVDTKRGVFEELAKRNGIKVGKSTETPVDTKKCRNDCVATPPVTSVTQASTQTDVTVVFDHCCQTDIEANKTIGVQVSASKEAFEEEYLLWKLEDKEGVDLCYKDLYFDEKKLRKELNTCLQNEKDVSANARHNHRRVMDQLKEDLSGKSEEVEKLKKDLKTLKKHKETEIKRISKELKSKEEDLEGTKIVLQLKETALEALRLVAQEQTTKLKSLEEQLDDMKTAVLAAKKSNDCEACLKRRTEGEGETAGLKGSDQEKQNDDGWTVIVAKKSKSGMHKPTLDRKEQCMQQHKGVDQLCEIDLTSPPCSYRQSVGQKSSISDEQVTSSCNAESSESTGGINACGEVKIPISMTTTQAGNITKAEDLKEVPSTLSSLATEPLLSSEKNQQTVPSDTNSIGQQLPVNVHSSNGQQPVPLIAPPGFVTPATPFPVVPPELFSQYLYSLQMMQNGVASGGGVAKNSAPLRRPPGLNIEPVPEGEAPEHSSPPATPSAGKFSSFDKLMEALQMRFPSKNRRELILYLKKAKAVCGSAGFRGKQIPDVVKCVEDLVELEGSQESEGS